MRPVIRMHAYGYDCSAAHGAHAVAGAGAGTNIARAFTNGNMRERREGSSVCIVT